MLETGLAGLWHSHPAKLPATAKAMLRNKSKLPPDRDPLDHLCSKQKSRLVKTLVLWAFIGVAPGCIYSACMLIVMRQLAIRENPSWPWWVGLGLVAFLFMATMGILLVLQLDEDIREARKDPKTADVNFVTLSCLASMVVAPIIGIAFGWYPFPMVVMFLLPASGLALLAHSAKPAIMKYVENERRIAKSVKIELPDHIPLDF